MKIMHDNMLRWFLDYKTPCAFGFGAINNSNNIIHVTKHMRALASAAEV